jgi:hypothetical protein
MPESKKKKNKIIEILSVNRERERKYIFVAPDDVAQRGPVAAARYSKQKLLELYRYVDRNGDEFVTADHPDMAPLLPPGIKEVFDMPSERTRPRERIYFADASLKVLLKQVEFRQELGKSYGVKQTVKRGGNGSKADPTLDRREFPAKLAQQGIHLAAIDGKDDRNWLAKEFKSADLKPAFRMISQRLRTSYHPDGDQSVLIELACDVVLIGETVFGDVWHDPKLEIEIKRPERLTEKQADAILDREEKRLMTRFGLVRQFESNGALGCEKLRPHLATPGGRAKFDKLRPADVWWTAGARAQFGLSAPETRNSLGNPPGNRLEKGPA